MSPYESDGGEGWTWEAKFKTGVGWYLSFNVASKDPNGGITRYYETYHTRDELFKGVEELKRKYGL